MADARRWSWNSPLPASATSHRLEPVNTDGLPVVVDAMGGDDAPESILAGARLAVEAGRRVLIAGPPELLEPSGLEVLAASEVISMDEEPGISARKKKDSSLIRAAEAVRDRRACALISAGNTGAVMAAALLRLGRIRKVARPAVAVLFPVPGRANPTVVLDCGANADCTPAWLLKFARMGAVYSRVSCGVAEPRIGLLSNGEESGKGSDLVKESHALFAGDDWTSCGGASFVGNVEGRDLLLDRSDVIVTDGFTGNVLLKTAEGVASVIKDQILAAAESSADARAGAKLLFPALLDLYNTFDPDNTGGAILLGVRGVCTISHGSSSPKAIASAIGVADDLARAGIVEKLTSAVAE